jgi:hypothetical protein
MPLLLAATVSRSSKTSLHHQFRRQPNAAQPLDAGRAESDSRSLPQATAVVLHPWARQTSAPRASLAAIRC